VQGIGGPQARGPAAQAGAGIAEVLRVGLQQPQAWCQMALKALQTASAWAGLRAWARTLSPSAEWSSVALQGLIARGAAADATNASAALDWISGVSSASSTQVSR
jgi:hypothetical protein